MGRRKLAWTDKKALVPSDGKSHDFDVCECFRLRFEKNLSFTELEKHFNIPRTTIHYRLKKLVKIISDPQLNQAYADNRVNIFTGGERILFQELLNSDKLKDASLNNVAYAFDKVFNARQVTQGLMTTSSSYVAIVEDTKRTDNEIRRIQDELTRLHAEIERQ